MDILGVSDPFCVYPAGTVLEGTLAPFNASVYIDGVRALQKNAGLEVVAGLEFDWTEAGAEPLRPYAEGLPLDYRIGSVHHVAEGYPSAALLKRCRRRGIPVTLSSDAHQAAHLIRDFERGAAILSAAGYDRVARFRGREQWFESLADAVRR